jgi:hypothetical protein
MHQNTCDHEAFSLLQTTSDSGAKALNSFAKVKKVFVSPAQPAMVAENVKFK